MAGEPVAIASGTNAYTRLMDPSRKWYNNRPTSLVSSASSSHMPQITAVISSLKGLSPRRWKYYEWAAFLDPPSSPSSSCTLPLVLLLSRLSLSRTVLKFCLMIFVRRASISNLTISLAITKSLILEETVAIFDGTGPNPASATASAIAETQSAIPRGANRRRQSVSSESS
ncbi:hypothetical protein B0H19DRAFT_1245606 [Mycena capillaripes]|nr:hypothetical protein B0H19DRAFT_1245606 [Mycena capillaripes]